MNSGFLWIIIASVIGFGISAISTSLLKLRRNVFLLIYIPVVAVLFALFVKSNEINLPELFSHNWYWGLAGAVIAGVFVLRNVFSQPSSPRSRGGVFVLDIIWPGLAYGLIDAVLLSIIPVLALKTALTGDFWTAGWAGKISFGFLAMIASFIVTTAYHWGFPEFRGKRIVWPNVGNGVLTLAFLLTMNPLAAILPHMAMHVAAMIHGRESTGQVPPHYNQATDPWK